MKKSIYYTTMTFVAIIVTTAVIILIPSWIVVIQAGITLVLFLYLIGKIQRSSPPHKQWRQEIGKQEMVQHLSNIFIGLYQQAGSNTIYLNGFISEIPEKAVKN